MGSLLVEMLVATLLGAGAGAGVLICKRAIRPRPEAIPAVLARLDAPIPIEYSMPAGRRDRLERLCVELVERIRPTRGLDHALELCERNPRQHAVVKAAASLAGLFGMTAMGIALDQSAALVAIGAIGAALAGPVLVDRSLRIRADRARRAMRHAVGSYMDLVNILIAGGAGIEAALHEAACIGDGPAFTKLRAALDRARRTAESPWQALTELGDRLGMNELRELAANVSLAGTEGARIRVSLAAKTSAMRGHLLAETETQAKVSTERMTIPLVWLLAGFFILIGYPALMNLTRISSVPVP